MVVRIMYTRYSEAHRACMDVLQSQTLGLVHPVIGLVSGSQ